MDVRPVEQCFLKPPQLPLMDIEPLTITLITNHSSSWAKGLTRPSKSLCHNFPHE